MAKNLYNLTAVTTVNDSDLLHVNQGSVSSDKKVTKQNLLKEVNSSISSINNSLANKQDNLSWSLAYSGTVPKSSSYTFTSDGNHLYFIVYGTWNYKGVFFVNTQNGNAPQIFEVFHTAMCSISASGTWGFTINNLNANYNLPVYIFQFL